jgi:predicted outer membrane protein
MKEIEAAYVARKRSQAEEVPKYLKITEIDMYRDTFKKVLMLPKVIAEG